MDGKECTNDLCTDGVASNPPKTTGADCTEGGGTYCDMNGECVECLQPIQCPGTDSFCATRACADGECGFTYTADGTPLTSGQVAGDCQVWQCDGAGNEEEVANDLDLPVDNNDCTGDLCTSGAPSNPDLTLGTACSAGVCDDQGQCVGCNVPADCDGTDTFCATRTCANDTCGFNYTAVGTDLPQQTPGDCRVAECNGNGGTQSTVDDTDILDDGTLCTVNTCTNGTAGVSNAVLRATCSDSGGTLCDGNGNCVECIDGTDCTSGVCTSNECQAATCGDSVENGNETDVDCGGGTCDPCEVTESCLVAADCESGGCTGNVCQFPQGLSTVPADGASSVPVDTSVAITFSAAMNPTTLTAQTAAGTCSGSIQVSSDNFATCVAFTTAAPVMTVGDTVATLALGSNLTAAGVYKVRVTTAAADANGNALSAYT
ncbi:MAG: hypothetical protein CVU63_20875, partial [Deltaproteobacteria bacterium HGW-Deltaproteobacteria-20]